jgi:hypothetical protein
MIYLLTRTLILKFIICRWHKCINHCQQLTRSANKPNINTEWDEKLSIANGLSLNIEKTNVIHIKWNHLQDSPFQISYQNVEMKEVTNTNFLGLRLDQHMEWKTHIDLIITKISSACSIPSPAISCVTTFMLSKGGDNEVGGL